MTKEELIPLVKEEYKARGAWLAAAKKMRESADQIESADLILATMLRRHALAIEEFQNRIRAYALTAALDEFDRQYDERDKTVSDLFTRVGIERDV